MDKEAVVSVHEHTHTHPRIQLSHKRNTILPFAKTWMDMEGIMLNEKVRQKNDKYCMLSLINRLPRCLSG